VPTEFGVKEKEFFDPAYTRALYDLGYDLALRGVQWTDGLGETAPAAAE
jgi:hypothetical protein